MADVVAGFAMRDGLVLLGKRKEHGKRGGLWECPGGKVEEGEGHAVALQREWKEELNLDVRVGDYISEAVLDLEIRFTVFLYVVEFSPLIIPAVIDHEELRWVDIKHAIEYMPCSPAMYLHYPGVRGYLHAQWEKVGT